MQGLAVYGESEDREILVKEGFRTGAKKDSFVLFLNFAQNEKDAKKRICYGNMCRIIESVKSQYRTGSGC